MHEVLFLKFKEELEIYNMADLFLRIFNFYYSTYKSLKTSYKVLLEIFFFRSELCLLIESLFLTKMQLLNQILCHPCPIFQAFSWHMSKFIV